VTNRPRLPPTMKARNGASCVWKLPLKLIIIRISVTTPRNRKKTLPRLTPTAVRELA
jgi:hypothetical protein